MFKQGKKAKSPLLEVAAVAFLAPAAAHAYIDPGIGAAIITAVLGMFGAISYTFRNYVQKIKDFFNKGDKKEDS